MSSLYDPSRDTVGKIYRDAQINNTETSVINGDLTHEMMKSLVEDLNDTINANAFRQKVYYIMVHEKKDLQMQKAILRRMLISSYRPWPEDDTVVFKVDPSSGMIWFCWCLPHWSEMDNMLANREFFDKSMIQQIVWWKTFELHGFGFIKDMMGNWVANLDYDKDQKLGEFKPHSVQILKPHL